MKKKELVLTINTITAAKSHVCDYCGKGIVRGSQYHCIDSRIAKEERFAVKLRACHKHDIGLLPLSFMWKRK